MKRSSFVAGFVLGGMLFGGVSAIAANGMMATPSSQSLFVDGIKVDTEAYNINGSNYFKLRDVGQAVNFAVEYDAAANAINVDTSKKYGAVQTPVAEKNEEKQNQTTAGLKANKSVASQFDVNGRLISIATNTGDIIYGTGNDKTRNPNAIGEWAGYFEITGDGKPLEPARAAMIRTGRVIRTSNGPTQFQPTAILVIQYGKTGEACLYLMPMKHSG